MKINVIEPTFDILTPIGSHLVRHIERCGRVCYKSEDRISDGSAEKFVRMICRNHHESVLEHASVSVVVICSRAASHQLVRHRLGAYSQESQRYVNYEKRGYEVICPPSVGLPVGVYDTTQGRDGMTVVQAGWYGAVAVALGTYEKLLESKCKPEDARFVLPNACKTELAVTYNLRQWRHVFRERALNDHAQWEIKSIMRGIYNEFRKEMPSVFGDLE